MITTDTRQPSVLPCPAQWPQASEVGLLEAIQDYAFLPSQRICLFHQLLT